MLGSLAPGRLPLAGELCLQLPHGLLLSPVTSKEAFQAPPTPTQNCSLQSLCISLHLSAFLLRTFPRQTYDVYSRLFCLVLSLTRDVRITSEGTLSPAIAPPPPPTSHAGCTVSTHNMHRRGLQQTPCSVTQVVSGSMQKETDLRGLRSKADKLLCPPRPRRLLVQSGFPILCEQADSSWC